ncbi:MAG: hypothetical protein ACTHMA_00780 [Thermomicrobiales bacterium]
MCAEGALTRQPSAAEYQLARERVRLTRLQGWLTARERELAAQQEAAHAFEDRYRRQVGRHCLERELLEDELAGALARLGLADLADQRRAAERERQRALAMPAPEFAIPIPAQGDDDLKKLYCEVARRLHPDLATDDEDRPRRTQLMAEANRAYAEGDAERLRALLAGWDGESERATSADATADLTRVERRIAQIRARLDTIARDLRDLRQSELWQLRATAMRVGREGRDLLAELAAEQHARIAQLRRQLAVLLRWLNDASRPRPARTLKFPDERSLGTLATRPHGEQPPSQDWTTLGPAQNVVTAPAGVDLCLRGKRRADLAPLAALAPDAFQALDLAHTGATNVTLSHLRGLTDLHELNLACTEITDDGLRHLLGLIGLRRLNLSRCYITAEGVAALGALNGLEALGLAGPYLTDEAVPYLQEFPCLRELDLSHTAVTDASLPALASLTPLRRLTLAGSAISRAGIAALAHARPDCVIA